MTRALIEVHEAEARHAVEQARAQAESALRDSQRRMRAMTARRKEQQQ